MPNTSLAGRVAFVTGASQGIGATIARALAERGAAVAGFARTRERIEAAMDTLARDTGAQTLGVAGDVSSPADVAAAVAAAVDALGPIDLLVNNAGLIDAAEVPVWEADPDQWWAVVESHIRGAFLTVSAVVPAMVTRGSGTVVNLASGMGTRAVPEYSAYSVGKAGQIRFTEALAESLRDTGVGAFNIAPGLVRTDMTTSMPMWDGRTEWTPPELVTELVCAAAEGRLDAWSGRFLRAGVDEPETVREVSPTGAARQLRLQSYGEGDPLG